MVQTRSGVKNNDWITFMRTCSEQYKKQKEESKATQHSKKKQTSNFQKAQIANEGAALSQASKVASRTRITSKQKPEDVYAYKNSGITEQEQKRKDVIEFETLRVAVHHFEKMRALHTAAALKQHVDNQDPPSSKRVVDNQAPPSCKRAVVKQAATSRKRIVAKQAPSYTPPNMPARPSFNSPRQTPISRRAARQEN